MIIIGHRGARGLAAENTLAAIAQALAHAVDEVEVDVRITRDGVPILHHDRAVYANGRSYAIAKYTESQLRRLKPDLTTLAEAIVSVRGRSVLHIEVKHGEPVGPVVALLARHSTTGKQPAFVLGSKSQRVLRKLHEQLPAIPKIVIEPWSGVRATYRARKVGTKRISMRSWWLWRGFLRMMQRRGYQLTAYTINDPRQVKKWQPYLHGVVTDYPDRFSDMSPRP